MLPLAGYLYTSGFLKLLEAILLAPPDGHLDLLFHQDSPLKHEPPLWAQEQALEIAPNKYLAIKTIFMQTIHDGEVFRADSLI